MEVTLGMAAAGDPNPPWPLPPIGYHARQPYPNPPFEIESRLPRFALAVRVAGTTD
jgi:hypothetical protein